MEKRVALRGSNHQKRPADWQVFLFGQAKDFYCAARSE